MNYCRNLVWCDKYILLSSKFKKPLLSLLKEDKNVHKIEAIHNPCVISDNQETYNKSKRIIYVGRLDNNFKRIDWLIKTIGKLFKENPEWKFTICGDGPDREYLTQLAHSISTQIEILGYCDPTEYYKDASIIVMSSNRCEGWGMVLVEAMNYGVVPVATKTYESLEDIIDDGKCGYIIDKGSDDFSLKLQELMNNTQLLKTFSQNAQNKVKEFDINNISNQWYKLFDKCCSR